MAVKDGVIKFMTYCSISVIICEYKNNTIYPLLFLDNLQKGGVMFSFRICRNFVHISCNFGEVLQIEMNDEFMEYDQDFVEKMKVHNTGYLTF